MAVRRSLGTTLAIAAWYYGMSFSHILILGIVLLLFIFVVVPTIFHYSPMIQRHMVFLPWVQWPKNIDFNKPQNEGLPGTRNFYIESEPRVQVGVWHILPQSFLESFENSSFWFQDSLSRERKPIILYLHGNTGSRGRDHRIEIYKVLRTLDYHVIAFDYRGYADSSQSIPTKSGVMKDAMAVYKYITFHASETPIFVWGHSLGTAVSSLLVNELISQQIFPYGLILESPFNNIHDEIKHHPMSYIWRKMPYFNEIFTGNLLKNDVGFTTDKIICNISIHILILHAEDDLVVPFKLGEKLYQTALASRSPDAQPIRFISFSEIHGYGHIHIYAAPELPNIISEFVSDILNEKNK